MADAYDSASGRATRGRTQAQHRAAKARRIADEAARDPRSTTELREARDAAWAKVCTPTSTRWTLTAFERADDLLRARCAATGETYSPIS